MLIDRIQGRGLYIGGTTHKVWVNHTVTDAADLSTAYQREWVKGSSKYVPTDAENKNFLSIYKQATALFT
jgi:hypothetical protein